MSKINKSLIVVLAISTLIEVYLGVAILAAPAHMMHDFSISTLNDEVLYMATTIGWFCLVTAAIVGLSTYWVYQQKSEGLYLAIILGVFWLGIGLHLGIGFARPQHLVLDAAKGAIILVLAMLSCRKNFGASKS